jgi:hypothetical protein
MRRIRNEISFGIAAVSLIGLANPAAAKDNDPPRLRPDVELHVAKDGRGDTQDFRDRPTVDRTLRQSDSSRPQPSEVVARPAPQLKTEIALRANGERDRGVEVEVRPGVDLSRPLEQKDEAPVLSKKAEPPQFKTEILMKVTGEKGSDESVTTSTKAKAADTAATSAKASIATLPVVNEVKMRAGRHNVDSVQGETDER